MSRALRRSGATLWLGIALYAVPLTSVARANDDLEAGVAAYEEASFDEALAAFARAESSAQLTRADLVRLLFFRALVHSAYGSDGARDVDLLRLASLEPEHPLRAHGTGGMTEVPPAVRAAFDRLVERSAGPLVIHVDVSAVSGGARLQARADNDPGGLCHHIVIEVGPEAAANASQDGDVTVQGAPGSTISYRATAVGPGGAILRTVDDEQVPLSIPGPAIEARAPELSAALQPEAEEDDSWAWWLGGISAGLLVAGGVALVLVFVLTPSAQSMQLSAPTFP